MVGAESFELMVMRRSVQAIVLMMLPIVNVRSVACHHSCVMVETSMSARPTK